MEGGDVWGNGKRRMEGGGVWREEYGGVGVWGNAKRKACFFEEGEEHKLNKSEDNDTEISI